MDPRSPDPTAPDDPAGSEQRLRREAANAPSPERDVLLTRVARVLGLQERYDEGHAVLDEVTPGVPEVDGRVALERGRLVSSAGDDAAARPLFDHAAALARESSLDDLLVDAMLMSALVAGPDQRLPALEGGLAAARTSGDLRTRDRDASILHEIGLAQADAGDHAAALVSFEEALEARERIGDHSRTRAARWRVAWALRHLDRRDEALALQRALRAELEAWGEVDPQVEEELTLLAG